MVAGLRVQMCGMQIEGRAAWIAQLLFRKADCAVVIACVWAACLYIRLSGHIVQRRGEPTACVVLLMLAGWKSMAHNRFLHVLIAGGILGQFVLHSGCDSPNPDTSDEVVGEPSQDDLEAIADGPPSEARSDFNLASSVQPAQGNGWNRVCAASLTLKSAPGGAGGYLGTLYNGYWFYKTDTNGAWSAGYSNELGMWGWVLSQYLC